MAEAQAVKAPTAANLGVARIAGRIEGTRTKSTQQGKVFFTLFKLPAPDSFSSPSTVEIRSGERIGATGDEASVLVTVKGYPRSYDANDGEGGKTTVRTAENVLDFVGHA